MLIHYHFSVKSGFFSIILRFEKSQEKSQGLTPEKKSQGNPNSLKKSQDLGIKSQGWQHW